MKTVLKLDGSNAIVSIKDHDGKGGESRWTMGHDQIAGHVTGLSDKDHAWAGLSPGDKSALRDARREHEKKSKGDRA